MKSQERGRRQKVGGLAIWVWLKIEELGLRKICQKGCTILFWVSILEPQPFTGATHFGSSVFLTHTWVKMGGQTPVLGGFLLVPLFNWVPKLVNLQEDMESVAVSSGTPQIHFLVSRWGGGVGGLGWRVTPEKTN